MRLRTLLAVLALAVGLAAAAVGMSRLGRLPLVSDVWPLDLAQPGGWLVDRQLSDLGRDHALCAAVLKQTGIVASPVPDMIAPEGCGWSNAVRVAKVGDARLSLNPVTCQVAAAMALWVQHVVQPAAAATLGSRVIALEHVGTYACRNMRGTAAFAHHPSQHASANAVDISAFRLADGRRVTVLGTWGKETPEARFLREVHAGACAYFRVVIGPAYNAAHRDHFHLDRGRWRACR
jgi:hypothetical protein